MSEATYPQSQTAIKIILDILRGQKPGTAEHRKWSGKLKEAQVETERLYQAMRFE